MIQTRIHLSCYFTSPFSLPQQTWHTWALVYSLSDSKKLATVDIVRKSLKESIEFDRFSLLVGCTTHSASDCFKLLRSINNQTLLLELHRQNKILTSSLGIPDEFNCFVKNFNRTYCVVEALTTSSVTLRRLLSTLAPMTKAGS